MKKEQITPDIFLIHDFLTVSECNELIKISNDIGFEPAKVNLDGKQQLFTMVRNNERILHKNELWERKYWSKLMPFIDQKVGNSEAIGLNELFRFYKYLPHQRFKKHRDGSFIRDSTEFSLFTFMVYLNEDYKGGNTLFDNHTIEPKKGMALVFKHELKHEGQKIVEGIKYVLRSDVMYKIQVEND